MKLRLLLTATFLIPCVAFASEAPKVKISGRLDTTAGYVSAGKGFDRVNPSVTGGELQKLAIVNDTKIDINIDGLAKNWNLKYGGLIRLHADTSRATNKETSVGDKTMFYLQHDKLGRFEAGNMPGAGGLFEMDILFFNKGSWGVDGFWSQWVIDKTKRTSSVLGGALASKETRGLEFIVSPNLPSNYSGHHYSDAPKASFFTKPIPELTVGVSIIPNMDSTGTVARRSTRSGGPVDPERSANPGTFKEIISGGLVFEKQVGKEWKYKVSAVGEKGQSKLGAMKDLKAIELGGVVTYKTFKIGATYGDWFDSYTLKSPVSGTKHDAWYWTAGVGQDIGNFGYSLTYMESRKSGGIEALSTLGVPAAAISDFQDNKFNNFVIDIEYKIAQGFTPFVGLSNYRFKESTGAVDSGQVLMVGSRILF